MLNVSEIHRRRRSLHFKARQPKSGLRLAPDDYLADQ